MSGPSATAIIHLEGIEPFGREDSELLATKETARMGALLSSLEPAEWAMPTDCPAWDVRDVAGHVLGMIQTFSSYRSMATTMFAGSRAAGDGAFVDGLTSVQVKRNASLSTDELVDELVRLGPRQARWRASRRAMRPMTMKETLRDGTSESWRMAYLLDTILTRDMWMHRVDISRATGRAMDVTADHDGRIVADAAAEWGRRHGRPCTLELTGPAGGTFEQDGGGAAVVVDAIDFCRILSGRGTGEGLLAQEVPF